MLLAAGRASATPLQSGPALPGPAHAWTWQNPLPQDNELVTIGAVDDAIVIAGGTRALRQSAEAGGTWHAADVDTSQTIPNAALDSRSDGRLRVWSDGAGYVGQ